MLADSQSLVGMKLAERHSDMLVRALSGYYILRGITVRVFTFFREFTAAGFAASQHT